MKTNILTLAITLTLGVILLGSLLVPVIEDAQTDLGDPITKSNAVYAGANYTELKSGDVYTFSVDGISFNDDSLGTPSSRPMIVAEAFSASLFTTSSTNYVYINMNDGTAYAAVNSTESTITIGDGTVTFAVTTGGGLQTKTMSCTWAYGLCLDDDAQYTLNDTRVQTSSYISNKDQIISAAYRFGSTNAFYSYHNQTLTCGSATTLAVTTMTLTEGTTDIYNAQIAFTIGSDSFTPDLILVPMSVEGHATEGSIYSLLGVIPVLVIIGLVLAAVSAIVLKRD